ncbi:hypothetical protein XELAEV_18040442mg [Xenopus laevis]|uniref:G-protein coupled receptors family 1 profile domain-containing protein n=1 Tax=Xenopus laevis TaxID=8355 RepID=A0A974C9N1_XENLA|nr:hypothetical protein XELAEV_18040442mg [Xenopus laevis]
MENSNQTSTNRFILLGLTNIPHLQAIYVSIFFIVYITTLSANSVLIVVVRINEHLQTPMYLFLSNLSVIDICLSSTTAPRIIISTLSQDRSVSLLDCALQMFFHGALPYCSSHSLNHFFCEMPPFFQISCRDTWPNELAVYITASIIAMFSFLLTLISYIHIISTILKIRSSEGRRKSFSHLTVVSHFYGTILFMYMRPHSAYSDIDKAVSIQMFRIMRNKDVKGTIRKHMNKHLSEKS